MSKIDYQLGECLSYRELAHALQNGFSPIVEVESMDGIYTVRFHHANGVSKLSENDGQICSFLGTGEIRDKLGQLGIEHGILTFADQCGDEMIGVAGKAMSPEEMLTYGTRIAFK